ncbi:MAG: hypothetical protein ABSG53_30025 [Thermoguttaceae bacterium]
MSREIPTVNLLSTLGARAVSDIAYVPKVSLAAETGAPLFAKFGKALAESNDLKSYEVPDVPGGILHFLVDSAGMRATWELLSSKDRMMMYWKSL